MTVKIIDRVCDSCEFTNVTCYESTIELVNGVKVRICGECGEEY